MDGITRNSKNDDFDIVPVARSYENRDWERVAGPYAQDLKVTDCCSLAIPRINSNLNDNGRFLLLSFSHQLDNKQEVSRFLQQTTFGPTMDMINKWNFDNNLQYEMADWIKDQMNENVTPSTSHRAYFRERLDHSSFRESIISKERNDKTRPRHPCKKYARWREFAFTNDDNEFQLTVANWNGQILLSIDGIPRTVVSSFQDRDGGSIGTGDYWICKLM
jgi:hypothetical protein